MTRRRKLLQRLALGLLVFAAAEAGLRAIAHLTLRERSIVADPDLGWRYLPNVKKVGRFWGRDEAGWTNDLGWRDAETPIERDSTRRRLVLLGDSFTFGVLADYGERFSEVIEELEPGLEAVNLAMNAIGPDQELRILETAGVAYAPDVVVLTVYLGNDLDDIRYARKNSHSKPWYELDHGELVLRAPVVSWDERLRGASYLAELLMRPFDRGTRLSEYAPPWREADTTPLFAALVQRMERVSREAGAHFLVVLAHRPSRLGGAIDRHEDRAIEALREAGISLLDTLGPFTAAAGEARQLFASDGHWSPAGHQLVAELLAEELRRRGWI